jgi:hypothetical protein
MLSLIKNIEVERKKGVTPVFLFFYFLFFIGFLNTYALHSGQR